MKPQSVYQERNSVENYNQIIEYTRNKTFKFEPKENVVRVLRSMNILQKGDSDYLVTRILDRLIECNVLKVMRSPIQGEPNWLKFTGAEDRWHDNNNRKCKDEYLQFKTDECVPHVFLTSVWARPVSQVHD